MAGLQSTIDGLNELKTLLGEIEQKYSDIEKASQTTGSGINEGAVDAAEKLAQQAASYKGIAEKSASQFSSGGSGSLGATLDPSLIEKSIAGARDLNREMTKIHKVIESINSKPLLEGLVIDPATGLSKIITDIKDINTLLGQPSTGTKLLSSMEAVQSKTEVTKEQFEDLVDLAVKFSNTIIKAGTSGNLAPTQLAELKAKGGVLSEISGAIAESGRGDHELNITQERLAVLKSGAIGSKIDEGQEVTRIQLTDNWAASLVNLKAALKGISDEDLEKTFDKIKETITSAAQALSGLDTTIESIDFEWNEKATEINAAYQARSGSGGVQHIGKESMGFNLQGDVTRAPAPRRTIKQSGQADILDSAALGRSSALYERITQEMDKYEKQLVDAGKASSDFSITLKSVDAVVSETGSSVEISAQYMKQFSDATAEAGKTAREFKVEGTTAAPDLAPIVPQTKLQSAMSLFQGTQAQTTAQQSLTKALQDTGLTLDNIAKSEKDSASGLTRITLASQTAGNASNRLTVILNKQGKVVQDLRTRYSGFFGSLQKNFSRVMRFALVSSVIYKGLNQLQQIPALLGDIDEATSRLSAISGRSLSEVNGYFNGIIQAARTFGVEATDALSGAEAALQAVGGKDQGKATALLTDSMLIAKVTGDSLAGSLDMLVAALSQYDLELDNGSKLIGKWIGLNRVYNVSMTQLARTYSVAGTQARDFIGTTDEAMDTFNGMITVLAKLTPMSSSQLGNFFKTTLTNFSSPTVESGLAGYGISIRDANHDLRNVQDVMEDIYNYTVKFQARSPDALANITRIWGGGGSKQATQLATLIQNWDQVDEATKASAMSAEQAAENYEEFITKLTDNLKVDFGELKLAVTEFFKAFGESEMIPQLRDIVQTLTGVVDKFAESPQAVAGFLSVVVGTIPKILLLNKAMLGLTPILQGVFSTISGLGIKSFADLKVAFQLLTGEILKNRMSIQSAGISIGAALLEGISSGAAGDTAGESIAQGLVTALLGIAGGTVFGVPGSMIGIAIADQINRAFAKELQFERSIEEELESAGELSEEFLMGMLKDKASPTEEDIAGLAINMGGLGKRENVHVQGLRETLTEDLIAGKEIDPTTYGILEDEVRATIEFYDLLIETNKIKQKELTDSMTESAEERAQKLQSDALSALSAQRQEGIREEYRAGSGGAQVDLAQEARRREYLTAYIGEDEDTAITGAEYKRLQANLTAAPDAAINVLDALGENAGMSYDDIVKTLTEAPEGSTEIFTDYVNRITEAKSEIEQLTAANKDATAEQAALNEMITDTAGILGKLKGASIVETGMDRDLTVPSPTKYDVTGEEYESQLKPAALKAQEEYLKLIYDANVEKFAAMGIDSWAAYHDAVINSIEAYPVILSDSMVMEEDLMSMFGGAGKDAMDAFNESIDEGMNIRRLKDVDPSQMAEIEAGNRYWTNYLANARGQTPEDYLAEEGQDMNLILGENNTFQKILTTNEAMNFTLQDILDTEKKQLEGMWNIPEGATFWVPLSSAFNQKGGSGGYPELPPIQDTRTGTGTGAEDPSDLIQRAPITENSIARLFEPYRVTMDLLTMTAKLMDMGSMDKTEEAILGKPVRPPKQIPGWSDVGAARFADKPGEASRKMDETPYNRTQINERLGKAGKGFDIGTLDSSFEKMSQQMTFNVVVPEPKEVIVEATINSNIMLDGRPIAAYVDRVMSRTLSKVIKNERYTMGVV